LALEAKENSSAQEFLPVTVLEYWCGVVHMYKETGEAMYVSLVYGTWYDNIKMNHT